MIKNVATKIQVSAYDYTTGAPKTGDAANITLYLTKDGGALTALTDTSATELSSTNAPGVYVFDVTATESNADDLYFTGKSATANVVVVPARVATVDLLKFGVIAFGTGQAATSTTFQLAASETFADSTPIGMTLLVLGSSQGYWQSRVVTGYVGSTDTATVDAFTVTPTGTFTYMLLATAPASAAGVAVIATSVRAAIGMASANLDTQQAAISNLISGALTRLPSSLVGGKMDSNVSSVNSTSITGTGVSGDNFRPNGAPVS